MKLGAVLLLIAACAVLGSLALPHLADAVDWSLVVGIAPVAFVVLCAVFGVFAVLRELHRGRLSSWPTKVERGSEAPAADD